MKHRRKSKFHNEHGFTLIESTLVIIVIGLLAIIAVPKILSTDKHAVYIAGHQITADMRYARGLAIANAESYKLTFSLKNPLDSSSPYISYTISNLDGTTTVKSVDISAEAICTPIGAFAGSIIFTALGSTASKEAIILLTIGSYSRNISVVSATGRVWEHEPS